MRQPQSYPGKKAKLVPRKKNRKKWESRMVIRGGRVPRILTSKRSISPKGSKSLLNKKRSATSIVKSATDTAPSTQHSFLPTSARNRQIPWGESVCYQPRLMDNNPWINFPPNICRSCSLSWFQTSGLWRAGFSSPVSCAVLLFGNLLSTFRKTVWLILSCLSDHIRYNHLI